MEKQSPTTWEELYRYLKLHDSENVMYRFTEGAFTIKLDEPFEINGKYESPIGMISLSGSARFDGGGIFSGHCTSLPHKRTKRKS